MKVLTVANQKGGVGKSALSVHIAWGAQQAGKRTLVVDFDGQGNTTATFTSEPTGTPASLLFGETAPTLEPQRVGEGLWVIPADVALGDVEGLPLASIARPKKYLQVLQDDFDVVVIDTPPNLGRRLLAALIAADFVLSPVALNGYGIQGIQSLQQTILTVKKRWNPRLQNLGILPNMVVARSQNQQRLLAQLRDALGARVLPFELINRVAVSDAIDSGHPVWKFASGESSVKAGREMKAVVGEILRRMAP